ncbi:Retrovirus-related Pol polyprotein from transposon 17.6 [Vitis vinifera]|uniref:RNA-directed DNA polymerase n=1 Tax=Vitis vinifera TaxID=29760 RepID=A0A438K7H1_VITVI|nr:Retrovirus-related Pol polyprotein from transposon 17.6 [Vitis vinifera]
MSPLKYKDPGCPTISVMIGGKVVEKALLDLGASVNLLPYSVYKQLGLGELKPTSITLSLADRSVKIPRGIIEDVLVQVDNFYYPLITPEEEEGPEEVCIIDTLVEEHCNQNMQDKLNESLEDLEEGLSEPADVLATLQGWRRKEEILPLFNKEEAQEAEISLLEVLKRCKKAIGWQISDLKGISPLVCTHHIYMEEEAKPIRQPQRRLNPHLQEVVRAEVLKLLQAVLFIPYLTALGAGEVSGHPFYCFLDGYSGYFQIEIDVEDQEKTTFTCPFGTYAYRRMPFGLCNAPATFQRCMLSIFSDMVERIMEVFMDDITIYGGIVLGHIISEKGIEVDKAKVELIVKLPSPTTVKGVRQFLGHAGFYRRFIKDFSKLSKPLCELLAKDAKSCTWPKRRWEALCDLLCKQTLNEAQRNYTTTEKELLAVVFALDKFRAYLVGSFIIVFTDHSALKYLLTKQDAKASTYSHVLPINDDFPEESLMLLEKTPWYAHIANYLVTGEVPNQIIRKCVPEEEQQGILSHCHENACGGHFASQKKP